MPRQLVKRLLPKDRSCGSCRLCCKLLKVGTDEEAAAGLFAKPQGKWCPHAQDRPAGGCAIYEQRPPACVTYKCAWLGGLFADDARPDQSKLVVSLETSVGDEIRDDAGRLVMPVGTPVWCVYEWTPGIAQKGKGKAIVEELAQVVVEMDGERGLEGPFPICIIPSPTAVRMIKLPGMARFVACLRPGERDPRVPSSMQQSDATEKRNA